MQFTQEKRRAMETMCLAFGNPDLGDRSRDLGLCRAGSPRSAIAYPGARVYVRREATEEKGQTFSPARIDIIHFASTLNFNENEPLSSAILLAKAGKRRQARSERDLRMDLKANLVC